MYIYIYTHVYIYIYIVCLSVCLFAWLFCWLGGDSSTTRADALPPPPPSDRLCQKVATSASGFEGKFQDFKTYLKTCLKQ